MKIYNVQEVSGRIILEKYKRNLVASHVPGTLSFPLLAEWESVKRAWERGYSITIVTKFFRSATWNG